MIYIVAYSYREAMYELSHHEPPFTRKEAVEACVLSTTHLGDAPPKLRGRRIEPTDQVILVGRYYEGRYFPEVENELRRSGWTG